MSFVHNCECAQCEDLRVENVRLKGALAAIDEYVGLHDDSQIADVIKGTVQSLAKEAKCTGEECDDTA